MKTSLCILVAVVAVVFVAVAVTIFVRPKERFFEVYAPGSVIPYRCDADSTLFFDMKYTCYPQSQLVDACNQQLKSKFPTSSHQYTKGKCLDDTHSQYNDPQGCKQQLQCTPDISSTCSNQCELKSVKALQDCNNSGGDLSMCSFQKSCSDACEVKELVDVCASRKGDLSKCTQAAVNETVCRTKCAMQDTQSINECIANKATDFSVCTPNSSKDYVILGRPPNTRCVFMGTNKGKLTRQDCINANYVV
jgi:hypothetical protein